MINLIHGDCLVEMKNIPDGSIDCILTDPPYGTTACKWAYTFENKAQALYMFNFFNMEGENV